MEGKAVRPKIRNPGRDEMVSRGKIETTTGTEQAKLNTVVLVVLKQYHCHNNGILLAIAGSSSFATNRTDSILCHDDLNVFTIVKVKM